MLDFQTPTMHNCALSKGQCHLSGGSNLAAAYLSQRTGRAELVRDHSLDLQTKYASDPMLGKTGSYWWLKTGSYLWGKRGRQSWEYIWFEDSYRWIQNPGASYAWRKSWTPQSECSWPLPGHLLKRRSCIEARTDISSGSFLPGAHKSLGKQEWGETFD